VVAVVSTPRAYIGRGRGTPRGTAGECLWAAQARLHAGIACFVISSSWFAHNSCRTPSRRRAAPRSRCGRLTRPRHPACARWHALRRDPRRVGSWPALPRAALQAHRGTPGPLCSQEGALNLLLSLALARWIKVGERYPAGRPNSRSGARQEARQLSTRAALGAHSLLNVPARRRERCR